MKIFRANSVFQGKRRLFKILNDKKYIFNTVNSGHTLFFRASTSCSKILNVKTIFNAFKIFRANSVFSSQRKLFKILKDKNTFNTVNSGHTQSFRASKSCWNILNVKSILNRAKNCMTNFVFRASASSSKTWKIKIFQSSEKFQGKLCFSGHAQVVQNSEWLKIYIFNTINSGHTLFFRASHKLPKGPER